MISTACNWHEPTGHIYTNTKPMNELLTAEELAAKLKMNHHVVLRWTRAKKIKPELYVGRQPRFDEAKVRKQIAKADQRQPRHKLAPGMVPTF